MLEGLIQQPALEILPIDITRYQKGNNGIEYAYTFDSGKKGPHAVISALTHGNELCGAYALDFLLRQDIQPEMGSVTYLFSNVSAYHSFDPQRPFASRFVDEDMNRLWNADKLATGASTTEMERARVIHPLIEQADYLLDLHSMHLPSAPLMLCGEQPRAVSLAKQIGAPTFLLRDKGHAKGLRMRDYGKFNQEDSRATALLLECGQHFYASSTVTAVEASLRFLIACGVLSVEHCKQWLSPVMTSHQHLLKVYKAITAQSNNFEFVTCFNGLEQIKKRGTLIAYDGEHPVLTEEDDTTLIMPARHSRQGLTSVRLAKWENINDF